MNFMDELWGLTMCANSWDEFKGTLGMNPGDELLWVGYDISIRAQGLKFNKALMPNFVPNHKSSLLGLSNDELRLP